MKHPAKAYDVFILGAGPAGLTAALRLLEMGFVVGMIEREMFPRHQIGESLSPGIRNIFSYLTADHLLQDSAYITQLPAAIIWEKEGLVQVKDKRKTTGIVVDRSKLDNELLAYAVTKGLHLLQPATLKSAVSASEGWLIDIVNEGTVHQCFSRIVLDARGRNGTPLQERIQMAPSSVAIWTHLPARHMPKETIVEAIQDGWLWASPVANDQFRIMAFTDADSIKKKLAPSLARLLGQTRLLSPFVDQISPEAIKTCSVNSFVHVNPWNNQFIKIGEAAFTLDPLSSSGVEKAMRFSLQTAIAVNTFLQPCNQSLAKAFYEEKLIDAVVNHARWTSEYYSQAWPTEKQSVPFWKKRTDFKPDFTRVNSPFSKQLRAQFSHPSPRTSQNELASIPTNSVINFLWDKHIRVSPLVKLKKTFAVINDLVVLKDAIYHPDADTPLLYLDQIDILPLITDMESTTFGGFIERCNSVMPLKRATQIAVFLWYKNILVVL